MSILQIISILFIVTALAGYINHRFIQLPMSIGLLLFSTFLSLIVIALGHYKIFDAKHVTEILTRIDFEELVLHGILSLLLFAGALQVDSSKLKPYLFAIGLFSTVGVILAAFATAGIIYYLANFVGIQIDFIFCLLFGALIAPIASVVAGLVIGNKARATAMSEKTIEHVDMFFNLIDEILNALLFVLIGLQIVSLTFNFSILTIGAIAVFAVLVGRFTSLMLCGVMLLKTSFNFKKMPLIMTWCGLRGGISIALALSLPSFSQKETLLAMTYIVVIFSIIVQGTTLGRVINFFEKK